MYSDSPLSSIPKEMFHEVASFLTLPDKGNLGATSSGSDRWIAELVRKEGRGIFKFIQYVDSRNEICRRMNEFTSSKIQSLLNSLHSKEVLHAIHVMNDLWTKVHRRGRLRVEKNHD
ncbi:MAG: hypothetical protein ACI9S8_000611 [Chlamydiales bacterium]|jgi:hypothetical protein